MKREEEREWRRGSGGEGVEEREWREERGERRGEEGEWRGGGHAGSHDTPLIIPQN